MPSPTDDGSDYYHPLFRHKMSLQSALAKGKAFLTPRGSSDSIPKSNPFIFPKVDPVVDGEDCDHDCATCTISYPKAFKIDEEEKLYGRVDGWATHMLVATGKTDWVKHVEDERGSVMEAVRDCKVEPSNGKLMLSASDMPLPSDHSSEPSALRPTTILLLPAFTFVDNVTPKSVPELINHHISPAPTSSTPLHAPASALAAASSSSQFQTRPCPHKQIILLCSQRTRDARCGQSAPLLKREFERHLRPLGLYRDQHDKRPGGVGIYFISHVGGHKFSANAMIYRRADAIQEVQSEDAEETGEKPSGSDPSRKVVVGRDLGEGAQCIWLARIRPEDCEGIIKYTVLQGKVVKPERQLRGGFDRGKMVTSW